MTISYAGGSVNAQGTTQLTPYFFERKALVEARKKAFFGQLADRKLIPKNMGKELKLYHYLPVLDDANLNDQGIDAAGVIISPDTFTLGFKALTYTLADNTAATAAETAVNAVEAGVATATGADVTLTKMVLVAATQTLANAVVAAFPAGVVSLTQRSGNLYGSSKDVGKITASLPLLGEEGGRVNRIGFTRKEISGSFENYGIFREWTKDLYNFDSDAELQTHLKRETVNAAMEITEDIIQKDLLNNAGVLRYTGIATTPATLDHTSTLTYADLKKLSITLDNNRCPKQTTIITGTTKMDTKTIPACRVAYIGSELLTTLEQMVDYHSNPAFVSVEKYAAGTTLLEGEVGKVGDFRFIVVPEMQKWEGAGATASNAQYFATGGKYDVFPLLVVGDESFTTIGFQGDGQVNNFKTTTVQPENNAGSSDPFGKTGTEALEWWYGFLLLRGERIALIKTVAKM